MQANTLPDPRLGPAVTLAGVRVLMLDVDGVLTDGQLYLGDSGEQIKAFHSRDGHGLRLWIEHGGDVAILTGRESNVVEMRCADLGIKHLLQGRRDKGAAFEELLFKGGWNSAEVAFVGDDLVDLPAMRRAGLAIAVADAAAEVRSAAHFVTTASGGKGAVREVCEALLKAKGAWTQCVADAWTT